jgi:hypothetical protein
LFYGLIGEGEPMRAILLHLWRDERGSVPVTEAALVASVLVLGAIIGTALSSSLIPENDNPPAEVLSSSQLTTNK